MPDSEVRENETADDSSQPGLRRRRRIKQVKQVAADVASRAQSYSESIFSHMFTDDATRSAANMRRRAMSLVDVLVDQHKEVRLKRRWILTATLITFCYLRYILPIYATWGSRHLEKSMAASAFAEIVGGPYSQVSFGVLVVVTLMYYVMLRFCSRIMESRMPVKSLIFELLVVYNMMQMLLNTYVVIQLLRQAMAQGFPYPWGNLFVYTRKSHDLGYFIWFHYHCCQLELFDTLFMVLRKKFQKITYLHVCLRVLNMWAWFFACRFACGGDAYFPAAVNALTRAIVYAFYSLSLLTERGFPFFRKARINGVQIAQFVICALHAFFCLYKFWNMQIPRSVLILYVLVMMTGLVLYTDFHYQAVDKSQERESPRSMRKVSFSFDSSGWFYCYHFGVAAWLREHTIPKGLGPEDAETEKFPAALTFSGSSGGALVAAVLSIGLEPSHVFEMVLQKRHECRFNPCRMLPAVEDVVNKALPSNAWKTLTGRIRVVLTRLSWRYPFISAEVVNSFRNNRDAFHALRGSCHVPFVAGLLPYRYDGHLYIDGMFWPNILVPWKGSQRDFMVRVSAFSVPMSDIKPLILPPWWSIFPPSVEILRGLYWHGYRDAAAWFKQPASPMFDLCTCRYGRSTDTNDDQPDDADDLTTWAAARKLLLRSPREEHLPEVDDVTGRDPREFVDACTEAIHRNRRRAVILMASVLPLPLLGVLLRGC